MRKLGVCKGWFVAAAVAGLVGCGSHPAGPDSQPDGNALAPTPPTGNGTFDALAARPIDPALLADLEIRARKLVKADSVVSGDPRLGVPTFLWTGEPGAAVTAWAANPGAGSRIETAARAVATDYAKLYKLDAPDVAHAIVSHVHDIGGGAIIVTLHAELGGIEIFAEEMNVVLGRDLAPIAIGGFITSPATPPARPDGLAFRQSSMEAAALALGDAAGVAVSPAHVIAAGAAERFEQFAIDPASGVALDAPLRVKKVYYHLPDGLEAAYYVEVQARTDASSSFLGADGHPIKTSQGLAYVISAVTGTVLHRHSLTVDSGGDEGDLVSVGSNLFTYRVWADPVTFIPNDTPAGNGMDPKVNPTQDGFQAAFIGTNDVTLANAPFSKSDPWLLSGATETNGNNADAYLNQFAPDVLVTSSTPSDPPTGDFRAQTTSSGQFLHAQAVDGTGAGAPGTAEGRQGAIQQMFYDLNFLHDWYYDAGFTEAAGNAQANNFGRGGSAGDAILAFAQDLSGFSNANMTTPADGGHPVMRMFVFPSVANLLTLTSPSVTITSQIGVSMSGPQTFDLTGGLVVATFSSGPCAISNLGALTGAVAMFDLDNDDPSGCDFNTRFNLLQSAPVAGLLVVNAQATPNQSVNFIGFQPAFPKPLATIAFSTKLTLTPFMPLTARLHRFADRDGTIDNEVIFHEFFHYVSNRLIANGSGLGQNQSGGLGEGWSDFNSMLMMVRSDDVATNPTFAGIYPMGSFVTSGVSTFGRNDGYYFGIRRYPYSTDMSKNPLTLGDIANGTALTAGPPVAFGADGANNAEVHNTGEVWTTMLWECYAALLRDTLGATPRLTFQQAQDRMKGYLIAALKTTPANPTFVTARDALLAVALAGNTTDYLEFLTAFAKRGAGPTAAVPAASVATNSPVTESFTAPAELSISVSDGVGTVTAGTSTTYTITAASALGSVAATGATVDDTFPAGLTCTWTCSGTGTGAACTAAGSGNLHDTAVNLPPNTSVTYVATCALSAGAIAGTLANTATVAAPASLADPITANNSATDTDAIAVAADLAITKTDGVTTATPGGSTTYTITASNAGPSNASGATVVDMFPASLTCSWTCVGAGGGTCTLGSSGDINATVNLPSGGSVTYTASCTISAVATGSLSNTATVTAPAGVSDPVPGNNSATDVDALGLSADLSITDTDGVTSVTAGNSTTYTIVVSNAGPDLANGTNVNVTFPAGATCPWTCAGAGGGACSGPGSGSFGATVNLPSGGSVTYTATCAIPAGATGSTLTSTATVTAPATVTDPTPANNTATDTDTLIGQADLSITKTDGVTMANAGSSVTYAITASNAGPNPVTGATVADTFPASLTCTWTCAGTGSCTAGGSGNINDGVNLPSGASVTYTATCAISASATGTLSNTATIAAPGTVTDPTPGNNTATDSDTLTASADLAITKTDGVTTATPGGSVTYTITASNAGPSNATGATVADTFPASLTCTWTCTGAGSGTCTSSGSGNINNTVNLPSGASVTYTASCTISAAATGTLSNTATVTAPGGVTDPSTGNNSAMDTDTLAPAADLAITKTDGVTTATPGGSVTYTITASNAGPSTATGATVADTFPAALTCSWTCASAGGGSCITGSGSGNLNNTVNLPSGGSVTYTASCTISAAATGTLSNTATVTAPAGVTDPTPGNNAATDTDTLAASADLAITKTDGVTTATPGGSVTYTITASNAGPSNATGATVADTFPASLSCTWLCVGAGGGTCTGSGSGNINATVNLPSGGSVTYTATCGIAAAATGTLSNTATVTAPAGVTDPTPGNNSATDSDTLTPTADLSITKTDGVTTATPGGSVTYTITSSNAGPSIATGATVADTFPASLSCTWTCVGAGGGTCTASGSGNVNDAVNLLPGASVTHTVSCAIAAAATGTLSNTATVTAPAGVTDPVPGNNSATDSDTLTPQANLGITKTDGVTTAIAGGSVTYTITTSNAGPSNASGATMVDTYPAALTCNWTCTGVGGGTCTAFGSGNINATVNLPAGASVTHTVGCMVSAAATGSLSNTATVAAPAGVTDPTNGNNSATDTDTIAMGPTIAASKTVSAGAHKVGDAVTYTIAIVNSGTASADNAGNEFTDVLPAKLALVSASATSGTAVATVATNTVTWNGAIPTGTTTITITATILDAGSISNQATVSYDSDNNSSNDATKLTDDPSVGGASDPTVFTGVAVCGDGIVSAGEQCDDGSGAPSGCCSASCAFDVSGTVCGAATGVCDVVDTCNATGTCVRTAHQPDGTACDDNTICNGHETCQAGVCTAGTTLSCDDNNACSRDTCDPVAGCQHATLPNDSPCDDGTVCNGHETCLAGICQPGTPLSCSDGNVCTTDTCDATLGCKHAALPDDTTCDDGTNCGHDACHGGSCTGGTTPDCDDGNPCTVDTCAVGGGCQHTPVADHTTCDDGNLCNGHEQCMAGACTAGPALSCNDDNSCTTDTCDPTLGCHHAAVPDQTSCDDGTVCNGHEKCMAGTCTAGTALSCNDNNGCTTDTCDALLGCRNQVVPDHTACDDGTICNGHEQCLAGACTAGIALACDDGNDCTADACDAVLGCVNQAVTDGTSCDDGTLCNGHETCQSGTCAAGTALACDDGNNCTVDTCDALLGCRNDVATDGTSCDDGNACNGHETCQSGTCAAGIALGCDDGNPCTTDSCDAVLGCAHVVVADNTSCGDGNACNGAETCQAGACTAGAPLACDQHNPCSVDTCDPATGCVGTPVADGTSCSDANACNGDEVCQAGACAAGQAPSCDDGDECTADACDATQGCTHTAIDGCVKQPPSNSGCGCAANGDFAPGVGLLFGVVALVLRRRRRGVVGGAGPGAPA